MFDPSQPSFAYPQPLIPSSEPHVHPPGTLPYSHFGVPPHIGFQPLWVSSQPPPITFNDSVVAQPGHVTIVPGQDPNSFWANQPPNAVSQTLRCDICNVDCNNRDILEKHLQGKKHIRNVSVLDSTNAINLGEQFMYVSSTASCSPELEMKKEKVLQKGTAVDAVRVCTICNVVCNSQDVFNKHMRGKKHAAQVSLASLGEAGAHIASIRAQFENSYKKVPKKVKIIESAYCDVCKITCTSKETYLTTHISGRKHQNNLEQLKETNSGSLDSSIIGPEENPEAKPKPPAKKASEEELAVKRQRIVETGTAAGAIITCTICNVVCNSRTVYQSHLGGQKHKDMAKKWQESQEC